MGFPDTREYLSLRPCNGILLGKITVLFLEKQFVRKSVWRGSKCYFYYPVHLLFLFHVAFQFQLGKIHPKYYGLATKAVNHGFMMTVSVINLWQRDVLPSLLEHSVKQMHPFKGNFHICINQTINNQTVVLFLYLLLSLSAVPHLHQSSEFAFPY